MEVIENNMWGMCWRSSGSIQRYVTPHSLEKYYKSRKIRIERMLIDISTLALLVRTDA